MQEKKPLLFIAFTGTTVRRFVYILFSNLCLCRNNSKKVYFYFPIFAFAGFSNLCLCRYFPIFASARRFIFIFQSLPLHRKKDPLQAKMANLLKMGGVGKFRLSHVSVVKSAEGGMDGEFRQEN